MDTYTITFADDSTTDFEVTNGKGITGISKTGTSGLVDTYTISYNDGSTSTFTVTNGAKGDTGDSWYVWIRYSGSQPTQDSDMGTEPDNWMGIYSGTSSTAPVHYTDYDWFQIKGAKGDKGDAATIVSQSVTYQEGTSPNVQPSGTWTTTIPVVSQGNYLWTRTIVTFNSGNPVTFFSVARMGLDGSGSVSSVNNQSPDANGNVALTADDIPTSGGTSVEADLSGVKNTLNQLDSDITALDGRLDTAEDDIGAVKTNVGKILPVITGTTNNSGYTINSGDYFEANGTLYKASASIPVNSAWASSATAQTNAAIKILNDQYNSLNTKVTPTTVTISAASGMTVDNYSLTKIENFVGGFVGILVPSSKSSSLSSWLNIGTISVAPTMNLQVPFIDTQSGTKIGVLNIQTNRNIRAYLSNPGGSDVRIYAALSFRTTS